MGNWGTTSSVLRYAQSTFPLKGKARPLTSALRAATFSKGEGKSTGLFSGRSNPLKGKAKQGR